MSASQYTYKPIFSPTFGIGFTLKSNKKRNPTYYSFEALYRKIGTYKSTNGITDQFSIRKDFNMDFQYLSMNLLVKKAISNQKVYCKIGLSYEILLKAKTNMVQTSFGGTTTFSPLLNISKSGIGTVLGFGYRFGKLYSEIRLDNALLFDLKKANLYFASPSLLIGYEF